MISVNFTIDLMITVVVMVIMHVSMNCTNGSFFKNLAVYATLNTVIMIVFGLRGIGILLITWILCCIEGLPLIWIMQKIYDSVSFKVFIIITTISWYIVKFIFSFLIGL